MDSSNYVYIQQTENTSLFRCVAVFKTQTQVGQHKRLWYLSHWRAAMALTSLSIRAAPPEPSLLAFTKYGTKVSQHKRFWSLIALMSSDGSYEPKHLHSFASVLAFCIHKVWYSSNKHKRASTKRFWYSSHQGAARAHASIGIMQSSQSLRFTHAQGMEVEEGSDKAFRPPTH